MVNTIPKILASPFRIFLISFFNKPYSLTGLIAISSPCP